jgi:hypothetical protein
MPPTSPLVSLRFWLTEHAGAAGLIVLLVFFTILFGIAIFYQLPKGMDRPVGGVVESLDSFDSQRERVYRARVRLDGGEVVLLRAWPTTGCIAGMRASLLRRETAAGPRYTLLPCGPARIPGKPAAPAPH